MSFCKVKYCKTPINHTTAGHKCLCGEYGHGEYECKDNDKIKMLIDLINDNENKDIIGTLDNINYQEGEIVD